MSDSWTEEVMLTGAVVRLEPLSWEHRDGLLAAAADGRLWELWYTSVPSAETIDEYLGRALEEANAGVARPFAVRLLSSGSVVGSTRFFRMERQHRRLEIGHTWYARSQQRTRVNAECKRLMLSRAFEVMDCVAVEFRTHWHNHASRAAIARLGAHQDGVLRNHQIGPDGVLRDTVVFSILDREWPAVRAGLDLRLNR